MIAKIVHYELSGMTREHLAQILELRRHTATLIEDVIRGGVEGDAFSASDVTPTAAPCSRSASMSPAGTTRTAARHQTKSATSTRNLPCECSASRRSRWAP